MDVRNARRAEPSTTQELSTFELSSRERALKLGFSERETMSLENAIRQLKNAYQIDTMRLLYVRLEREQKPLEKWMLGVGPKTAAVIRAMLERTDGFGT